MRGMCRAETVRSLLARGALLTILLLCAGANRVAWAQNENETVGFQANHIFDSGNFGENIDVLNGGLNLTLSIGQRYQVNDALGYQLALSYNSKIWDSSRLGNSAYSIQDQVSPINEGPLGIGFGMHQGRIFVVSQRVPSCDVGSYYSCWTHSWYWVAPDGSQHEFYHDDGRKAFGVNQRPLMPSVNWTSDASFVRVSGPSDEYCYPSTETGCFRVETPDGLVRSLIKRVDCPMPSDSVNTPLTAAQTSEAQSFCGWYTSLIEDPSVGNRIPITVNGTQRIGTPLPIHVKVTYDGRSGFEHAIAGLEDSAGRKVAFRNCEWNEGWNLAVDDALQPLAEITSKCKATPGNPANRHAVATWAVDVPSFGGSADLVDSTPLDPFPDEPNTVKRAQYKFYYEYSTVRQADPLSTNQSSWPVLRLVRLDYPDMTKVANQPRRYSAYFGYENPPPGRCSGSENLCTSTADCRSGQTCQVDAAHDYGEVSCRTLPIERVTGNGCGIGGYNAQAARTRYSYEPYKYISTFLSGGKPPKKGGCTTASCQGTSSGNAGGFPMTSFTRGVVFKTLESPSGTVKGRWIYDRGLPTNLTNPQRVTVRDPLQNDTVYYYHASHTPEGVGEQPEDGFAPEWDDGMNYRVEYFEGRSPTGRLVRSELSDYDSDPYVHDAAQRSKLNTRVKRSTTQSADDEYRESVVTRSDWDSVVGKWRFEVASGTDVSAPRTTRTSWIRLNRPLPRMTEVSDGARVLSRTDNVYDSVGKLTKSIARIVLPPTAGTDPNSTEQAGDVVTTYQYSSASGNALTKTLSTGAGNPTYTIDYTYGPLSGATCTVAGECGGYLATKAFRNGAAHPWKSIDRDRDANTGLVIASRDTAQMETNYSFDKLGRITDIHPAGEETTYVDYPSLSTTTVTQGSETGSDYLYTRYLYDKIGRLVSTQKRPADPVNNGYACQKSEYDVLGRVTYRTEWMYQPPSACTGDVNRAAEPGTEFQFADPVTGEFDVLGRVRRELPADNNATTNDKATTYQYFGNSSTVTVNGQRDAGGTAFSSTTTYYRDAWNRLIAVDAPDGAADARYDYDPLDRLETVDLTDRLALPGSHQIRRFGYDGLGRQIWAENPENGVISTDKYDALGNVLLTRDAQGNVRKFEYDFAGRPTTAFLAPFNQPERRVSENVYDETGSGDALGKLTRVRSFDAENVTAIVPLLEEHRLYTGVGGRLGLQVHAFWDWQSGQTETTAYSYDTRGQLTSIVYPQEPGTSRTVLAVNYAYANGSVLRATEAATGLILGKVSYNAAGGVIRLETPGGGRTEIVPDVRNRPSRITVGKWGTSSWVGTPDYDSGTYSYDGAGNIYAIGENRYGYDAVNRLTFAHTKFNGTTSYDENYSYDVFGNMVQHRLSTVSGSVIDETDNFNFSTVSPIPSQVVLRDTAFGTTTTADPVGYSYDTNGNLVYGGRRWRVSPTGPILEDINKFDYDGVNRLSRIYKVGPSGSLSESGRFGYDSSNNRIWKIEAGQGLKTYYIRDASGQVLSEFRTPAGATQTPEWATDYVYLAGHTLALKENLKPKQPKGLRAIQLTSGTGFKFILTWDENTDVDKSKYKVWRKRDGLDAGYTVIAQPSATSSSTINYTDATVHASGVVVHYQVSAVDTIGYEGSPSSPIMVVAGDVAGPTAPTLSAVAGDHQVTLTWSGSTDVSDIRGYEIFRGASASTSSTDITPLVSITPNLVVGGEFVDLNLPNATPFYYRIRARDAAGNWGGYSCRPGAPPCDVSAIPSDLTPPSVPRNVRSVSTCNSPSGPESIRLTWEANPAQDDVASYDIFRNSQPAFDGLQPIATSSETRWTDPGPLTAGAVYYYAVRAVDASAAHNRSVLSQVVSASPRDNTIDLKIALDAQSSDGMVTLNWASAATGISISSYVIYRKMNVLPECEDYVRIGQVTSANGSYTDGAVANNIAYDYAVSGIVNGKETGFSRRALGIPLARPSGAYQCSASSSGTLFEWRPPAQAIPYHPLSASAAGGNLSFLKGYHLYHHQVCPQTWGGNWGFQDSSALRVFKIDPSDPVDPYLLSDSSQEVIPYDPRFNVLTTSQLSSAAGGTGYAGNSEFASMFSGCGGIDNLNCVAPKAVYKVYADGAWITVESDWPDYFDPLAPDKDLRCNQRLKDPLDLPYCRYTENTNYIPPPRKVTAIADGPGAIRIDWVPPDIPIGAPQIAGYYLYARNASSSNQKAFLRPLPYARLGPSETSLRVQGLNKAEALGEKFTFTVAAVDESGRVSAYGLTRCAESGTVLTGSNSCPTRICSNSQRVCTVAPGTSGCGPSPACATGLFCSNHPSQTCSANSDCGMRCLIGHNTCTSSSGCPQQGDFCGDWGYCTQDSCCGELADEGIGRWCTVNSQVECSTSSSCPLYNSGHCHRTTAQACSTSQTPTSCPAGEVCVPGEYCRNATNSATSAAGLETVSPGIPGVVHPVLWTVNDLVTSANAQGRDGIKIAWQKGLGYAMNPSLSGFRVYRSGDDGVTYCALLRAAPAASQVPPLPQGVSVCTSELDGSAGDGNALSTNVSADGATRFYWDRTVAVGKVYRYRVTQVATSNEETPLSLANEAQAVQLPYDPAVLPRPAGFRAYATQERGTLDERGIALKWCPEPAGADSATSYPTVNEYRVYRRYSWNPKFYLLARLNSDCADGNHRCEITNANRCPENADPETCGVIDPVSSCNNTTGPKCRVMDFSFQCWPQTRGPIVPDQQNYNYIYRVTAMAQSGAPSVVTETMPSVENQGWLNYCSASYNAQGGVSVCCMPQNCQLPGCVAACILNPCLERRDPDGDGDFMICGQENVRLDIDRPDAVSPPAAGEDVLSDYRLIGLPPVCEDCEGSGTTNPYNPPSRFVFYHTDHLGSPRVLMDVGGTRLSVHHYLPFGEERPVQTDPTLNNRAFTGHQRDQETGLDYMLARYYSSSLGRFMAVDPGNDTTLDAPQSWNKYAYVRNNPLAYTDSSGMGITVAVGGKTADNALGHIAIIHDGTVYSSGSTYTGPSGDWGVSAEAYFSAPNPKTGLSQDQLRETTLMTLNVSPEEEASIVSALQESPGANNPLTNSCAQVTARILEGAGVISPNEPVPGPNGEPVELPARTMTPQGVAERLESSGAVESQSARGTPPQSPASLPETIVKGVKNQSGS